VPDLIGGLGGLALSPANRVAISEHMNEDGCDMRSVFYYLDTPTGSTFSGYLTPIESPSYLFGQVASFPNGSFLVLGERLNTSDPPNSPGIAGAGQPLRRSRHAFVSDWLAGAWTVVPAGTFADARVAISLARRRSRPVAMTDFGRAVPDRVDNGRSDGTVTVRKL
jgi:hypothetical protein